MMVPIGLLAIVILKIMGGDTLMAWCEKLESMHKKPVNSTMYKIFPLHPLFRDASGSWYSFDNVSRGFSVWNSINDCINASGGIKEWHGGVIKACTVIRGTIISCTIIGGAIICCNVVVRGANVVPVLETSLPLAHHHGYVWRRVYEQRGTQSIRSRSQTCLAIMPAKRATITGAMAAASQRLVGISLELLFFHGRWWKINL